MQEMWKKATVRFYSSSIMLPPETKTEDYQKYITQLLENIMKFKILNAIKSVWYFININHLCVEVG